MNQEELRKENEEFGKKHPVHYQIYKKFCSNTKRGILTALLCSALVSALGIGYSLGSYNPLKIAEIIKQGRTTHKTREIKLQKLETKILRKAETYDGQAGLSFEDQTQLAKDLNHPRMIVEGEPFDFRYMDVWDVNASAGPGLYLNYIKVPDEIAERYLE